MILSQMDNLYRSEGTYGKYDMVYDLLKEQGHDLKYSKEIMNDLWREAKIKFAREKKEWIKRETSEERKKEELNKYFKSRIVAKYLLDKYQNGGPDGTHFEMQDSQGTVIKLINIVGYKK
ncbi:MAG: hypothetical protein WC055_12045 [Melioribacteraceae bacterium]